MLNNINKSIPIFTLTFVSVLLLFNRPFVGIYIFGIRLGELIIAGSLFLAVVIPAIFLFSKTLKINKEYSGENNSDFFSKRDWLDYDGAQMGQNDNHNGYC